jgi:PAS domain S-box-containing protein
MVNPAYERLTGYVRQELMGTIPEILKGNRSSMDFGRRVAYELSSSGYWSGEVIDRRKDGTEWHANLTISRVKDSRGKAFADVFVVRDITDKKNMEQQTAFC